MAVLSWLDSFGRRHGLWQTKLQADEWNKRINQRLCHSLRWIPSSFQGGQQQIGYIRYAFWISIGRRSQKTDIFSSSEKRSRWRISMNSIEEIRQRRYSQKQILAGASIFTSKNKKNCALSPSEGVGGKKRRRFQSDVWSQCCLPSRSHPTVTDKIYGRCHTEIR